MNLNEMLLERSNNKCELCSSADSPSIYEVSHAKYKDEQSCFMICPKCLAQIEKKEMLDQKHWSCLTTSMWSEVDGIQIVSWRMLNRLRTESWAAESLELMYLEEEKTTWAKADGDHESDGTVELHKDCNGQILQDGDTIVLVKSLDVKGSTLNAKMGTVVKNIKLVTDNIEQIEGKIEGQLIVILTKYVRKQS